MRYAGAHEHACRHAAAALTDRAAGHRHARPWALRQVGQQDDEALDAAHVQAQLRHSAAQRRAMVTASGGSERPPPAAWLGVKAFSAC